MKTGNKENGKSKEKGQNIFKVFIKLLPPVFVAAPVMFIVSQALSILHGVSWGAITLFTQRFFDSATRMINKEAELSAAIFALVLLGLVNIATQILNGVSNFLAQIFAEKAQGKLSLSVHEKMGRIAPVSFEDTKMLDDINKAEQGKNYAVWFVLIFLIVFTFYIPYFAFMAFYLYSLKPVLAAAIVIIFIPTAITQLIRTNVFKKLEDKSAPVRREFDYYEKCMVSREYFKETRLLGAFSYFTNLYRESLVLLNKLRFKADVRTNLFELSMKLVALGGYFLILRLMVDALMQDEITVGAFAAVFTSIATLFSIMEEVVCRHFGSIAQNLGMIQNYLRFLDIPDRQGSDTGLERHGDIVVSGVSFSYPHADAKAIDGVSFTIKDGETVAVVGENGSGKSTLVRLITGIYVPDTGDVIINGGNTRDVSQRSLYGGTSAVFQRFQRYQMTLRDNIGISDAEIPCSDGRLDDISAMAGFDRNDKSFTEGYDTMLSREFDGVDLSGGEWQRVAIARGFYREHGIIILDEPTAAIDPFEETKIYNRFATISKDKTAVIVTHRLGSVKLADRILVMVKGRLAESGTHDELMSRDGEYRRLYSSQEQWYR